MKLPYIQFYPGDWLKDPHLSLCSPATRGVWIDLICSFHESRTGQASGTPEQLARLCRCSAREMTDAITELTMTHTAEIEDRGGVFTIACRRMRKEVLLSKARSEAAKQRFSKANAKIQQNTEDEGEGEDRGKERGTGGKPSGFRPPTVVELDLHAAKIGLPTAEVQKFFNFYTANGWKVGRNRMKSWPHALVNWKTTWEERRTSTSYGRPATSVFELKTAREAKEKLAAELKNKYCFEGPLNNQWDDEMHKDDYFKLKKEIKDLDHRISASVCPPTL